MYKVSLIPLKKPDILKILFYVKPLFIRIRTDDSLSSVVIRKPFQGPLGYGSRFQSPLPSFKEDIEPRK